MSGAMLSDRGIRDAVMAGRIRIDPFDDTLVQPGSYDVHLGGSFLAPPESVAALMSSSHIRPDVPERWIPREFSLGATFTIEPRGFVLGHTVERLALADDLAAVVDGRSSVARLGLLVHATAGYVDAGWDGQITLELHNLRPRPFELTVGMRLAQLRFFPMSSPAERPYGTTGLGSRYAGAGVEASRFAVRS